MSQEQKTARDYLVGLEYFVTEYERDIKGLLLVLEELGVNETDARKRANELQAPPPGSRSPFSGGPMMPPSVGSAPMGMSAPVGGAVTGPPMPGSSSVSGPSVPSPSLPRVTGPS